MEIDVFADGFVEVPLALGGGVLAQAEVDGKPARLRVSGVVPPAEPAPASPAALKAKATAADRSVVVLYLSGKGPHKLELAVRLKLSKQGGWRTVEGVLPAAPATALSITAPQPQTELRLGQLAGRRSLETESPDETIPSAPGADGAGDPVAAEGG